MFFEAIQSKTFRIGKRNVSGTDIVFAAVFCAAAAYFILTAPYGITVCDETQYLYVNYRLLQGEKLFSDLWMAPNGYPFFMYLPFRVFYALLGGTEGVVLCMRFLHVGIRLILLAYIYLSLRRHGLWAVLAGVIYIGTNISGIKTMNYYSMCCDAVLLAGIFLFAKNTEKPFYPIAAGFLFSCAVVAEPVVAVVWLAYWIAVCIRFLLEKRGKQPAASALMLPAKVWMRFNIGVLTAVGVFLVLCASFFTGCDLKEILFGLKMFLAYMTGGNIAGQSMLSIRLSKLQTYAELYGWYFSVPFAAVFFGGVVLHRFTKKYEKLFFVVLTVLFIAMSVRLITQPMHELGDARGESTSHPLLLPVLALAAAVFTKQKDRKMFAFLILTLAVSFVTDFFSNNSFGSVLLPGSIPAVLLLRDYVNEQRSEPLSAYAGKKGKMHDTSLYRKRQKKYVAVLCALLIFIPSFEICHYVYMARLFETEHLFLHSDAPVDVKIGRGVLKGIVTTAEVAGNYEKAASDAEALRSLCKNRLYVIDYDTCVCLNAGARSSVPFLHVFTDHWNLENIWWTRHPERRPDVVYIPFFSLSYIYYSAETPEEKLAYFESKARIEVTVGKIGYIVKINQWY